MSNVAEIASAAQYISAKELAFTMQEAQISLLKQEIEVEALLQQQISQMIQEIMPHLGGAVDIAV